MRVQAQVLSSVAGEWHRFRMASLFREVNEAGIDELPVLTVSIHNGISDRQLDEDERDRKVLHIEDRAKYRRVRPGDIAYNMMRAWQGAFGAAKVDGLVSPAYVVARPIVQIDARYFDYFLRSDYFASISKCYSKGITDFRLRLYWEGFREIEVRVPPTDRQSVVADFLDRETARIDQLIEKKTAFVAALWEREEGLTRRLLSGERSQAAERDATLTPWLQAVPDHWEIVPLRYLVRVSTGGRDTQDRTDDGAYPFYVRSMHVERIDTYSYDEEAVLTSGDGAGVGKVFHHVNGKFELHQRMYAFTHFKRVTGRYFYHFLRAFFYLQMTQWSAKSTVDSVRMPFLKSMLFAVPPREEQEALLDQIDASLERTSKIVNATERSIEKLREFRAALITAAVTGQSDLTASCKERQIDRRLNQIEEAMRA